MNKQTQPHKNETTQLAEDATAFLAATADIAGEHIAEARKRLTTALDRSKEIYNQAKEKAIDGAKATDHAIHENPYQAIAIGIGAGALVGYLLAHRCRCKQN
jgi:ElaB/YqjD/DUF883 family membrane-anchored ribosome-binding protein